MPCPIERFVIELALVCSIILTLKFRSLQSRSGEKNIFAEIQFEKLRYSPPTEVTQTHPTSDVVDRSRVVRRPLGARDLQWQLT